MTNSIYFWSPARQEIADLATIRTYNPNASIPATGDVSVLGWFTLNETDPPEYNKVTQTLSWTVESNQSPKGPVFSRVYKVVNLPEDVVITNTQSYVKKQKESFLQTAQKKLDDFAKERGYDDIKSAVGYASSNILSFHTEAEICIRKRDEMWTALYAVLDKVEKKEIPIPAEFSEIEGYLPVLEWK